MKGTIENLGTWIVDLALLGPASLLRRPDLSGNKNNTYNAYKI